MAQIGLKHVRVFDNGDNTSTSFGVISATTPSEVTRLIGDLLLLTRSNGAGDVSVDFSQVESLINEAAELMRRRVDWLIAYLGIVESDEGLQWRAWSEPQEGAPPMRHPTAMETIILEGESRILWDAIDASYDGAQKSIQLLAAWGVYCCERAIEATHRSDIVALIDCYSTAGCLLGHANYLLGCVTERSLGQVRTKERGKLGGIVAASHWKKVEAYAVDLARERGLDTGDRSADAVAGLIKEEVRAFARLNGKDFPGDDPQRKVAEYLRAAGVMKRRRPG